MPGLDYEVHEKTRRGADHRAGCWNKPLPKSDEEGGGYYAPDRQYRPDGTWKIVQTWIPFRMSTECRYDQAIAPVHCDGCQHLGSGKKYDEFIRRNGT